jgi:hypothetical protein
MYGRMGVLSQGQLLPLGVQGARILKWPTNLAQGPSFYGLGHAWKEGRQQKGQTLDNEYLLAKPLSWGHLHFNARENISNSS